MKNPWDQFGPLEIMQRRFGVVFNSGAQMSPNPFYNNIEMNPNRESQQEYFGLNNRKYSIPIQISSENTFEIESTKAYNMNDDNRFGKSPKQDEALIRAQRDSQLQGQYQQQFQLTESYEFARLQKQLEESLATSAKMLEQKRDSEIEILQLKLEVAQLKLALAKAEK